MKYCQVVFISLGEKIDRITCGMGRCKASLKAVEELLSSAGGSFWIFSPPLAPLCYSTDSLPALWRKSFKDFKKSNLRGPQRMASVSLGERTAPTLSGFLNSTVLQVERGKYTLDKRLIMVLSKDGWKAYRRCY